MPRAPRRVASNPGPAVPRRETSRFRLPRSSPGSRRSHAQGLYPSGSAFRGSRQWLIPGSQGGGTVLTNRRRRASPIAACVQALSKQGRRASAAEGCGQRAAGCRRLEAARLQELVHAPRADLRGEGLGLQDPIPRPSAHILAVGTHAGRSRAGGATALRDHCQPGLGSRHLVAPLTAGGWRRNGST